MVTKAECHLFLGWLRVFGAWSKDSMRSKFDRTMLAINWFAKHKRGRVVISKRSRSISTIKDGSGEKKKASV